MKDLAERLNFSNTPSRFDSIEIGKWSDVNHYETLCQYCADNNIDLTEVTDEDFNGCVEIMADHGQEDKSTDSYFFWID